MAVVAQSSLLHVAVALVDVGALLASVAGEAVVAGAGEGEEAADAGGQRVAVVVARGAVVGCKMKGGKWALLNEFIYTFSRLSVAL